MIELKTARITLSRRLLGPAGRLQIAIRTAGIIVVVGKGVAMLQEVLNRFHRDGKTEAFAHGDFHVGHAHDFALAD